MNRVRSWWAGLSVAMVLALSGCSNQHSGPVSVSLSPSTPQAFDQGLDIIVSIKAAVANDRSSKGVTWGLNGPGSLPATNTYATYMGPTNTITSPQQATVTATSIADSTKSASVQITVNPYPYIPFQTLASGTVGIPYSQPIALIGGTAPYQWSVYNGGIDTGYGVGGSLPDGLTLNHATGMISGTPTGAGTWYFEGTATDADNVFSYNALSIQINPASTRTANAVPFLNQPLIPAAVSPGSGALTLRVSGTGFVSGATIDFNGTPLTTIFVDSEHLSALLPATDVATAGTASVAVVNPSQGGGASNVVFFQIGASQSTVTFANAPNSPLQIYSPLGLAIADFNQDGKPDLAVTSGTKLDVMLSNGDGTFTSASDSPISILSPPYDDFASPYVGPMAVGDFNHSGHAGLAVGEFNNEAAVILLGNGNGTLAPSSAVFVNTDYPTAAIEAADFNADGNLDLLTVSQVGYPSSVALGFGVGAFNSANFFSNLGFASGGAVGDFNGDGKLDVAIAGGGTTKYPGSGVTVSLGNGDGTFTQSTGSSISLGQSLSAIVAGDFNSDGKLDLAVTDYATNTTFILLGNGDGTFQTPVSFATGDEPDAIVAGDFNNDAKLDLAIANYGDDTVTLLLGHGDGTFTKASGSPYTVGENPYVIAASDFNGDGKLDLAVANLFGDTVSILLQQ